MGAPLIAVTRHSDANELTTDMELTRAVPVYFPGFALLLRVPPLLLLIAPSLMIASLPPMSTTDVWLGIT